MEAHNIKEVVVSSCETSTRGFDCSVWNPHTGVTLGSFKDGNMCPRTLSLLGRDYVVGAMQGTPVLKIWTWNQKNRVEQKIVLPNIITAFAISPQGSYCVAAISNKLFVWQICTGNLLSIIDFHHQDVRCIKFTDDGWYFVTGGDDAIVAVWHLSTVLNQHMGSVKKVIKPLYSWTNHSAAVTDIFIGHGGLKARVVTCSLDETCRVYDLSTGKLIFSLYADVGLHSVTMDAAEYFMYLGTDIGKVLIVKWYSCLKGDSLTLVEKSGEDVLEGHKGPVTCLSCSMDSQLLLSGSDDGQVKVWQVRSRSNLVTFKHNARVTNAFFTRTPTPLFSDEKRIPDIVFRPLKRSLELVDDPIEMKLKNYQSTTCHIEACDDTFNSIAAKGMLLVGAQSKAELHQNLGVAKEVNHQLYSFSMSSFLRNMKHYRIFED